MESEADVFDPFMESQEVWDQFCSNPLWNGETQEYGFIDDSNEFKPVPTEPPTQPVAQWQEQTGNSLVEVPKNIVANIKPVDPTEEYTDRQDFLPSQIAIPTDTGYYFRDSSFAKSFLCSLQGVSNSRQLTGSIIIPAKFCTRLRSGPANHSTMTYCYYVPEELLSCAPLE